jgi:hypothetical protein
MLIERVSCSGLGLVIGSIGHSIVRNITFKDSVLPHTYKGIYLKTRWSDSAPVGPSASISDIIYQNITIIEPEQFAIWMGPAQQLGQKCSLLWPLLGRCLKSGFQTWNNILFKDVTIIKPKGYIGVLMGNSTNPIKGVVLENVVVKQQEEWRKLFYGDNFYNCLGVEGWYNGTTSPKLTCLKPLIG